ncbi:MAG: GNAT family N-acetyltransferase [Rhodobacteraceae bacterium]|nr:GNAT family N-acetyltransferase [Paracoccaceae bacterium]
MAAAVVVRMLRDGDQHLLTGVAGGVFDDPVDPALADAFLRDPRHHMAAAIRAGRLVGFASAVDYWHPDKPSELFVNEVGVAPDARRRGLGLRLMGAMLARGHALGCRQAWLLCEPDNAGANALYARAGGAREGRDPALWTFDCAAAP